MRILILGAGGIGGFFGGKLADAGADVTFLVRPKREEQLAQHGLVIRSPSGDLKITVATVGRDAPGAGYDAILLSCKAYDLEDAISTIRPAAFGALILPMLNGIRHLDELDVAFGRDHVAGGVAMIGVDMEADGTIRQFGGAATLVYGARTQAQAEACAALEPMLTSGGFEARRSDSVMQDMWEKFVFITSNAGMCCLMRGDIGAIARTREGPRLMRELIAECAAVAEAAGFQPRPAFLQRTERVLTDPGSTMTASMLRDLRRGGRIEASHIVGDMLARARTAGMAVPMLRAICTALQVYEESL